MIYSFLCLEYSFPNYLWGFPGSASGKELTCQWRRCKRCEFYPWVRKIPWRRAWQPTPVSLPGEFHGRRTLVGYSPRGRKESDTTSLSLSRHKPGGASGKEPACRCWGCKRRRFYPWVRKIPWRRERLPTPVFLPGDSHRQRSLAGYSPWGHKSQTQLRDY